MWLFKKKLRRKGDLKQVFIKQWRMFLKCLILLAAPLPGSIVFSLCWYKFMYQQDIHFSEKLEGIVTAAWIPTFGILYSILAAGIVSTVWGEYKTMRTAVKRYDFETFASLRDEQLSPLMHALMFMFSAAVFGAFTGLKYPDAGSGFLVVSSTIYLFLLLRYVVMAIDDPCAGFWFIKSIPNEWLEIDVKIWRGKHCEKQHQDFVAAYCQQVEESVIAQ